VAQITAPPVEKWTGGQNWDYHRCIVRGLMNSFVTRERPELTLRAFAFWGCEPEVLPAKLTCGSVQNHNSS
jgi:hypothetical protein